MAKLELSFFNGEASLTVRRFAIREAMSQLFEVNVIARSRAEDLDLDSFVNKSAALRIEQGIKGLKSRARVWAGVVHSMEQVQAEETGVSTYAIRIVPTLWRTTLRRGNRIYQHLSIPDIVLRLLAEWEIEPELRIDPGAYPQHEYRVQYGETDFAFLSRLLEEAGIAYWFQHPEGLEGGMGEDLCKLVLSDQPQAESARADGPLQYVDNPNEVSGREYATKVRLTQAVRPGRFTIRDFDFRHRPDYQLFAEHRSEGEESLYEQYHYLPGAFVVEPGQGGDTPVADDRGVARVSESEAQGLARRSLEAERRDRRVVSFETNVIDLAPGAVFAMEHHPRRDLAASETLLVTSSFLEGEDAADQAFRYGGEAVFTASPYRPARVTPRPRIIGVQSAVVVGPRGEEIHTDEFGRVRVQFHWDREGALDERSSCWIRVSQAWAGASFGMMVIPRVGQEVLVDFFDGDPDRPIVVGRVYNNTTRVPYPLPENKTRSTWKSDSSPGSGGFNEIMFEDRKGAELMSIQAERNRSTVVKRDDTLSVGSNRSATIGQNDSLAVGANHSVTVGGSQSISVVGGRGSTIGTSDSIDAGEMYQLQVAKNGTGMRVIDNRIVISTAEACIVIDNDTIRLEANGNIILRAGESIVLNAGAPIAIDGEQVLLNCQGRDPQMVETVDAAADPGGPGGPDPGQRSVAAEKLSVSPAAARRPGGIADVRIRPDVPVPDEVIASLPTSPGAAPSALDLPPAVAEVISQAAGEGGGAAEAAARVLLRGPEGVMELVQLAAGEVAAALPSSAGRVLGPVLSAVSEGADAATLGSRLAPAIAEAFGAGERFAVIQQAASDLAPIFAAVRTQAAPGFFDAATMVRQAAAFEAAGMGPAQAASVAAATQGIALYQGDASGQLEKLPTE